MQFLTLGIWPFVIFLSGGPLTRATRLVFDTITPEGLSHRSVVYVIGALDAAERLIQRDAERI
ncbi:hypothetical protein E1N52_29110 [Paraburkholderia guartelaensis]|uniref:Uncharacterized protein n=1 Tax=Paraburkholderia guartelaensis TaxID=2546446 RepID=A0A4R5L8U6_9BURK|nr:hypothetical protein [Paraburkholderia guartelaensis]TDG04516.1 hypothetical protein E1N52_29110 [Paraburkholderia guartelaensis]